MKALSLLYYDKFLYFIQTFPSMISQYNRFDEWIKQEIEQ